LHDAPDPLDLHNVIAKPEDHKESKGQVILLRLMLMLHGRLFLV
jgi:hypothetical protein